MATPLLIAQQIFSALTANMNTDSVGNLGPACSNQTMTNSTAPFNQPTKPSTLPSDLTSLISFLISFSAMRDWVKLFVFGSLLESIRRLGFYLYHRVQNSLYIYAQFEDGDVAYDWMIIWLSKQSSWKKAREVQVSTRSFGLTSPTDPSRDDPDDPYYNADKPSYIPGVDSVHTLWYNRRWVRVTRTVREGDYGRKQNILNLCIFSWEQTILDRLLLDARKMHKEAQENKVSIFVSDTSNSWRYITSRPKRPLSSIVLDPGIKDVIMDDARDFLASKGWYSARGIPFRRGYLLYGAPGSGKTSIIHSLAGELGLDVYVISLSRAGLDDNALNELVSELPERCIALMEDIDAAFSQTLNRDGKDDENPAPKPAGPGVPTSRISLSGLLNALDGVGAQEGRILFATTNKYKSLDAALVRPGRMDIHIEFKLASKYQAGELYRCFYLPDSGPDEEKEKEKAGQEEDEKLELDSGYGSDADEKVASPVVPDVPVITMMDGATFHGSSHRQRAPKLPPKKLEALAAEFAEAIPAREFSMATLQGYLMSYKTRPLEAVKDAPSWVVKERADAIGKQAEKMKHEQRQQEEEKEKEKEKEEKQPERDEDRKIVLAT